VSASTFRAFVFALGTRGDLELFLALAKALAARGHRVRFGCPPWWVDRAQHEGLDATSIGAGTQEDLVAALRALAPVRDRRERTRRFAKHWLRPQLAAGSAAIARECAAADYVVNNLKLVPRTAAGPLPCASVTYDPPDLVDDLARLAATPERAALELVALPQSLVDPDRRFPPSHRFTGFWRDAPAKPSAPSPDLARFVEAGPPPVVVTLGSMATFEPAPFLSALERALVRARLRGVVIGGYTDVCGFPIASPALRCVKEAPYDWLLPRACCVVHHGGSGTVQAVLRGGRPSVLLPQLRAQEVFAGLLQRAGVVSAVLETEEVTPERLADALASAGRDPQLARRAREWQRLLEAEDGLGAAVQAIEDDAGRRGAAEAAR
jgi:UDP:flavonoid glycosyltransferase YjiC (YdhE family)